MGGMSFFIVVSPKCRYYITKLSLSSSSIIWASALVDKKFLGFLSNIFFKSPAVTHQFGNRRDVGTPKACLDDMIFFPSPFYFILFD